KAEASILNPQSEIRNHRRGSVGEVTARGLETQYAAGTRAGKPAGCRTNPGPPEEGRSAQQGHARARTGALPQLKPIARGKRPGQATPASLSRFGAHPFPGWKSCVSPQALPGGRILLSREPAGFPSLAGAPLARKDTLPNRPLPGS